ncbi:MAG TPA: hypothetical protein DEB09_01670 [Candidatus Magasanikbacteria bacterium]|nr:hypothetical protein [Candidatus Magasanikbacteria bacterium]
MKVVLINNLYKPYAVGGAERVVERRARELVDGGNDVVVITWRPWSGWGSWCPVKSFEDGINIYRFWVPNIFSYKNLSKHNFVLKLIWHFIDIFNGWSGRIIHNILKSEKPDLVETHNLMGIGYCLGIRNKELGINWRHYIHDVQLVESSGVLVWNHEKDNLAQKIYSWIMKRKFRNVDEVISPTKFLWEFYRKRNFFVYSNYVLENPKPLPHRQAGITHNPKVISDSNIKFLFVGSLVEHKGVRVLMQAWDQVNSESHDEVGQESPDLIHLQGDPSTALVATAPHSAQDDVILHIVGDGILHQEVKEWAKDKNNVIVHGRLEGEKLEEIYNECDVLIFPSICIENNPTVIHEALHHGLRVIASDTGGVKEIFGGIKNVELVEAGNVDELSEAVRRMI